MEIDILGTAYQIMDDVGRDEEFDGVSNFYKKEIHLKKYEDLLDKESTEEEKKERFRECVRHELIHCALFESGMEEWAYDEQLVYWISIQFPKLSELFRKMDVT